MAISSYVEPVSDNLFWAADYIKHKWGETATVKQSIASGNWNIRIQTARGWLEFQIPKELVGSATDANIANLIDTWMQGNKMSMMQQPVVEAAPLDVRDLPEMNVPPKKKRVRFGKWGVNMKELNQYGKRR